MAYLRQVWPALALALVACGAEPPAASPAPPASSDTVSEPMADVASDSLRLSVYAAGRVARGVRVPIGLEIANVSGRALDLHLRGREITVDVRVRDASGAVVWHRLEGAAVPAILQLVTMTPGETLALEEEWVPGDAPPGRYTIDAELLAETGVLSFPPATVELVP